LKRNESTLREIKVIKRREKRKVAEMEDEEVDEKERK
jgi:hypothetical protein